MYRTKNPDIFCCPDRGASSFGKGLCGQLRLLGLATAGILEMVVRSGFGRTSGLKVLAVDSNIYFPNCRHKNWNDPLSFTIEYKD